MIRRLTHAGQLKKSVTIMKKTFSAKSRDTRSDDMLPGI